KTNRHDPPTLKSPSQTASDQPRGPNHRLSSSHFVNASNTMARGASKTRTIMTSRSDGVVTLSVPVLSIWEGVGWSRIRTGKSVFAHRFVRRLVGRAFFLSSD